MSDMSSPPDESARLNPDRRTIQSSATSLAMTGGLLGSYGTFVAFAGRFLYPVGPPAVGWMFLATLDRLKVNDSLTYRTPAGGTVTIARQGMTGTTDDFVALSSTCPHLGCQVHWEGQNNRFFCPCHNGVFDPHGKGTSGPPGDAGQSLSRYPLKVENGLLFIEVPLTTVAIADPDGAKDEMLASGYSPAGDGHESARAC